MIGSISILELCLYILLGVITLGWVIYTIVKAIKKKKGEKKNDED